MKIIQVDIPIYEDHVVFCITADENEAKRFFAKNHISLHNWPLSAKAFVWHKKGFYQFVWLRNMKSIDTVSHEVIHIAWHILDDCGIIPTAENHEMLTYLHDFLILKLYKCNPKK